MFSITALHDFVGLFSLLLAYCMTIPFIGWFHAWVADKAGDDAGERMGLMSSNLMAHIDPVGFIFLGIFGIGWGRRVPVRFREMSNPYRWIKFIVASYANTFAYFVVTSLTILCLSLIFKASAIGILMASDGFNLTHAVGANSALNIAGAGFLQKVALLNLGMTRLSFVINTCYVLVAVVSQYWLRRTNTELSQQNLFFLFIFMWLFFFHLPFGSMLLGSLFSAGKGFTALVA